MEGTKYAIATDAQGYKLDLVIIETITDEFGALTDVPMHWSLHPDQQLISLNISTALSMLKPRWTGSNWEETASPEEVDASRQALIPANPLPTIEERLFAIEEAIIARSDIPTDIMKSIVSMHEAVAEADTHRSRAVN